MPPGVPLENEKVVASELEEDERQQNLPDELAVHGLIDDVVAGSHDLGEAEEADGADHEPGEPRAGEKESSAAARAGADEDSRG